MPMTETTTAPRFLRRSARGHATGLADPLPPALAELDAMREAAERQIPGNVEGEPFADDRLGPLGITAAAMAACGLVYLIAVWLKLF